MRVLSVTPAEQQVEDRLVGEITTKPPFLARLQAPTGNPRCAPVGLLPRVLLNVLYSCPRARGSRSHPVQAQLSARLGCGR